LGAGLGIVGGAAGKPSSGFSLLLLLGMMGSVALMPYGFYRLKRYQHGHYLVASERSQLNVSAGSFYKLGFKLLGVNLLAAVVVGLLMALFAGAIGAFGAAPEGPSPAKIAGLIALIGLAYLLWFALMWPYGVARLQNLVWGHTVSQHLRFASQLKLGAMARLTFKNFLLTAFTLGLYRPFAAVATARLRLESMHIGLEDTLDAWVVHTPSSMDDASGDVAGDFFGIDLGL